MDAALLANYDVVLVDGATLTGLSEAERKNLQTAVEEKGLGVSVLADDGLLTAAQGGAGATADDFFRPWRVASVGEGDAADNGRRVRLQGLPGVTLPAEPVAVAAFEIKPGAGQTVWLRDGQARTLAAAVRRGKGVVALSLVRDTWQWRQGERPAAFAEYWSWWLHEVAPAETAKGRWSVATPWSRVDQAMRLRWLGKVEGLSAPAMVKAEGDVTASRVALAQDRLEPARWTGDFWPQRAGWHRVTGEAGVALDFWVNAAEAWPRVRAQMKRDATVRAAAESDLRPAAQSNERRTKRTMVPEWLWLTVFVVSAGYLWLESRQQRRL